MDKIRVRFFVVSLIFVLALIIVRSEGNRKFFEALFGNNFSWVSKDELDQEKAEQVWTRCWENIDHSSESILDIHLNLPSEVEKTITNLPLEAQESLLDCLSRENLLLEKPDNDPVSTTWLEKFLDYLSDFSNAPRRILKSKHQRHRKKPKTAKKHPRKSHKPESEDSTSLEKNPKRKNKPKAADVATKKHLHTSKKPESNDLPPIEENPQKKKKPKAADTNLKKKQPNKSKKPESDGLKTALKRNPQKKSKPKADDKKHHEPETTTFTIDKDTQSPHISPPALTKSPSLAPKGMVLAPSRTPTHAPAPAPSPIHTSPEPSATPHSPIDISSPPLVAKPSPIQVAPKSEGDTRRYIIIASVAGAVALIALLALLLVCFVKRGENKVDPKEGQRDENPLFNICLSNISGPPEKAQGEKNPNEKIANTATLANNPTSNNESSPKKSPESPQSQITPPPVPPPPGKPSPPPPSAPPPPPPKKPSATPPPPPKGAKAPPAPLGKPLINKGKKSSLGGVNNDNGGSDSNNKAKLKPFFWDKVSPDQSMVWQDLKAGSFQVDEQMMETLFGYTVAEKTKSEEKKGSSPYNNQPQFIKIIDPKKAQNLSILLKALNVTTEEVCDALREGNELPSELIQNLSKMAPTSEEELKLRLYDGDVSMLGPAERFLKSVVEIPFAFKRMESLLFMSSVQEEVSSINESFKTLEVACTELKKSRLFLKLLEAVLKTGNRMNDGTYRGDAQAFKLDTLLKLSDVKGTDGKTTLLHFVVQEIIRSEGIRAARARRESRSTSSLTCEDLTDDNAPDSAEHYRELGLNVVSKLSSDLENVRWAALIDYEAVTNAVYKLGNSLGKIKNFLENENSIEEECEFQKKLEKFVVSTEEEIKRLVGEEKRIAELVKGTIDYFYGKGGKNEGPRLFVIVADFLVMLDKACKEVRSKEKAAPVRARRREALSPSTSSDSTMSVESNDMRKRLFPVITAGRRDDSSSDDDSFSP